MLFTSLTNFLQEWEQGGKKILFSNRLTWHLDFPVLVWTILLNPKSTFLFRHEF